MTPEQFFELQNLAEQAEESQKDIRRFQDSLIGYCKKLVSIIYERDLLTMESKGFEELNDRIIRAAGKLAVEVDNAVFNNQVAE